MTDSRLFWITIKAFRSEKVNKYSKINLVVGEKINSCDDQITETFSEYFTSLLLTNYKHMVYI